MEKTIIYEALYCCCIHESSYATISLHKTRKGAEEAIKNHKDEKKRKFDEIYQRAIRLGKNDIILNSMKFGQHKDWTIGETKLLE